MRLLRVARIVVVIRPESENVRRGETVNVTITDIKMLGVIGVNRKAEDVVLESESESEAVTRTAMKSAMK